MCRVERNTARPVFQTIIETIEQDIRAGKLQPGQRLPTHRGLARLVGVSVGTASRVYREMERRGLVAAEVGRGTFVTVDAGQKPSAIDVSPGILKWDMGDVRPLARTDPELWPVVRNVLNRRRLTELMMNPEPQGLLEHRAAGADWLARFGINVPPQNVVITAGAQNALFLICNSLMKPGDRLATDCLTSMGIKAAAVRNGIRLEGVRMDSVGMLPNELDALCRRQSIKALYLSGRIQDPTNCAMPLARRQELRNVIRKHRILLIENDLCGFLSERPDRNLSSILPEECIYISSVANAFPAGLRVAYVAAPPRVTKKLTQAVADTMLFVSPICAELAAASIRSGLAEISIQQKKEAASKRMTIFRNVFANHVFEGPERCLSVWLRLPSPWKSLELETAAARRNIRIFSAARFAVGPSVPVEAVRVSLTGVKNPGDLRKALHCLEQLVTKGPSGS